MGLAVSEASGLGTFLLSLPELVSTMHFLDHEGLYELSQAICALTITLFIPWFQLFVEKKSKWCLKNLYIKKC